MKIDKYNQLKLRLQTFKFEKSYSALNTVLYYFSFLGNIFLIYFGYFFVKSVTDSIPNLFPYQDLFFMIFVALFLTGYELTKRFALDRLFVAVLEDGKVTLGNIIGGLICAGLVAGSFYLSIKGAHRLVDNTQTITVVTDSVTSKRLDSVAKYYDKEIAYYRAQPAKTRQDRIYRDSIVSSLTAAKETKLAETESKTQNKAQSTLETNKENSTAFLFITVFLELLILLGVGFNAFYTIGTFEETGKLLQTPRFRQLELNLKLLKLYYQNGKKKVGDPVLSYNKFKALIDAQRISCTHKEAKNFIVICQELEIIKAERDKKYSIAITYEQSKQLLENQELV